MTKIEDPWLHWYSIADFSSFSRKRLLFVSISALRVLLLAFMCRTAWTTMIALLTMKQVPLPSSALIHQRSLYATKSTLNPLLQRSPNPRALEQASIDNPVSCPPFDPNPDNCSSQGIGRGQPNKYGQQINQQDVTGIRAVRCWARTAEL